MAAQQRKTLAPDAQPIPPAISPSAIGATSNSSRIVIVIVALLVIAGGLKWTAYRRAVRQQGPPDILNETNREFVAEQRLRKAAQARLIPMPRAAAPAVPPQELNTLPPELTESAAIQLISKCAFFWTEASVRLPRRFLRRDHERMLREYPALLPAINNELVTLDPSIAGTMRGNEPVSVVITRTGSSVMQYDSFGNDYVIRLGKPHVEQITSVSRVADAVDMRIEFHWSYAERVGTILTTSRAMLSGSSILSRRTGTWAADQTTVERDGNSVSNLCRWQ